MCDKKEVSPQDKFTMTEPHIGRSSFGDQDGCRPLAACSAAAVIPVPATCGEHTSAGGKEKTVWRTRKTGRLRYPLSIVPHPGGTAVLLPGRLGMPAAAEMVLLQAAAAPTFDLDSPDQDLDRQKGTAATHRTGAGDPEPLQATPEPTLRVSHLEELLANDAIASNRERIDGKFTAAGRLAAFFKNRERQPGSHISALSLPQQVQRVTTRVSSTSAEVQTDVQAETSDAPHAYEHLATAPLASQVGGSSVVSRPRVRGSARTTLPAQVARHMSRRTLTEAASSPVGATASEGAEPLDMSAPLLEENVPMAMTSATASTPVYSAGERVRLSSGLFTGALVVHRLARASARLRSRPPLRRGAYRAARAHRR